jgi:hypothetical protein
MAAGLFAWAGYSYGRVDGFADGRTAGDVGPPPPPSSVQTIVLAVLGGGALICAGLLQQGGLVRVPTPAKLDELAGRAEQAAIERAEEIAETSRTST